MDQETNEDPIFKENKIQFVNIQYIVLVLDIHACSIKSAVFKGKD